MDAKVDLGENPPGTSRPSTTTPPTSPAGDPPAANVCAREEAVDLHYGSASEEEEDSPAGRARKPAGFPGADSTVRRKDGRDDGRQLRSVVVKPAARCVSYNGCV